MIRRILSIGVPNGLENSMFQLGKILVLSLVSSFGTFAIAANAVCNVVIMFEILPGMALNLAMTTVIAQCVGAGAYDQVKYYTKKLMMMTYAGIWMINVVIVLLLPVILRAYNLSDVTADISREIMYFHTISCMLVWPFPVQPAVYIAGSGRRTGDDVYFAGIHVDLPDCIQLYFRKIYGNGCCWRLDGNGFGLDRTLYIHDNPLQRREMDAEESHLNVTVQPGGECLLMSKQRREAAISM